MYARIKTGNILNMIFMSPEQFKSEACASSSAEEKNDYQDVLEQKLDLQSRDKLNAALEQIRENLLDYSPLIPHDSRFTLDYNLNFRLIFELNEVGLLEEVLNTEISEKRTLKDSGISIDRYDESSFGLTFREETKIPETHTEIKAKFLKTPIVKSLQNAFEKVNTQRGDADFGFVMDKDLLQTATLLEQLGILGKRTISMTSANEKLLNAFVKERIYEKFLENAEYNETGEIERFEFNLYPNNSVKVVLEPINGFLEKKELFSTSLTTRVVVDYKAFSFETANGDPYISLENFIYRPTGQEFIRVLDTLGLKFSESFESFIFNENSNNFSDRYGREYTQISRNLAKILSSGDLSKLNQVFCRKGNKELEIEDIENLAKIKSEEKGFKFLQDILMQLITRAPTDMQKGVPSLDEKVSIQASACFDVYGYYLQAEKLGKQHNINLYGKNFLSKTHGKNTLINKEPVILKGITLPKGCLFIKNEKNELAFLRFTPFIFENNEDMISAFGTEVLKGLKNV